MKKAVFIPCDSYRTTLRDGFFSAPCYSMMKKVLSENGIEIHSPDMFDDYRVTDAAIFFDVPRPRDTELRNMFKDYAGKKIVFLWESPVVKPYNFDKAELAAFDEILTWNDDLVDDKRYFRIRWPLSFGPPATLVPFQDRKMLTMISGNKMSYHPSELYSERLRAARFFERQLGNQFDLYGTAWNRRRSFILSPGSAKTILFKPKFYLDFFSYLRPFKSYRGEVVDKVATLSKYKFSICYENMGHVKGYITEKIFDCLAAGNVPIYLGADNIADYVPKECFIDKRDFPDYRDLLHFLKDMSAKRHDGYLAAARKFMLSERAAPWQHEQWGEDVGNLLVRLLNQPKT